MERLICVAIGYLFGLFQTGYIYGKIKHVDIRKHGSGNAGATNALRTLGWKAGAITFLGDCLKCVLAVLVVRSIFAQQPNIELLAMYSGLGAVLGHNYPCYLQFKGGKGIATTAGLVLSINPLIFLMLFIVFVIILLTTKYVSLGSLVIAVLLVAEIVWFGQMGKFHLTGMALYEFYGIAVFLAALAFWRHRANIKRLITGTENKIDIIKMCKKSKMES